jgi:hypothetical protein
MKRPGNYGPSEGGPAKRQFGSRGPTFNKGRDDSFGRRDAAPRQGRPDRGGFDRSDRGGYGNRDRGGFEAGGGRGRPDNDRNERPRSFDGPSRRPESRSFGNNNGQSYRREGGMSGGYGRPARREEGGFQSFAPTTAPAATQRPPAGAQPVPAQKLKDGVVQANKALAGLIEQFGNTIHGDYDISQLEATVSFDRDGRFIGFGTGGAVSFSLTITPLEAEDVFAQDGDEDEEVVPSRKAKAAVPVAAQAVQAMADDEDADDADEGDEADDADLDEDDDEIDAIDLDDDDMVLDEDDDDLNRVLDSAAKASPAATPSVPPAAKKARSKADKSAPVTQPKG